jgi:uncharacterized protein (DUF362 family)
LSRTGTLWTTRRQAAAGVGASVLASCRRPRTPNPRVAIVRADDYGQGLYEKVLRVLKETAPAVARKRVLLKPNLVEFEHGAPVNTHPAVVHAAFEAFHALGAAEVRVAEGPGHRRITMDLAEAAGYFSLFPQFPEIFTDLNLDRPVRREISRPLSKLSELYLPASALACDVLVSIPKMKTHHWVGATLGLKNLFGVVPGGIYGWPKNVLHWAGIDESIADLFGLLPARYALVDGIDGMAGNGPIQGVPRHAGILVGGASLPAVDATCCRLMGIDPAKLRYLELCRNGSGTGEDSISQVGERIDTVRTEFELIPELRHFRLAG